MYFYLTCFFKNANVIKKRIAFSPEKTKMKKDGTNGCGRAHQDRE